jgi:hypothetical protein
MARWKSRTGANGRPRLTAGLVRGNTARSKRRTQALQWPPSSPLEHSTNSAKRTLRVKAIPARVFLWRSCCSNRVALAGNMAGKAMYKLDTRMPRAVRVPKVIADELWNLPWAAESGVGSGHFVPAN